MPRTVFMVCVTLVVQQGVAKAQTVPEMSESLELRREPLPPRWDTTQRLEWKWKRVHWGEIVGSVAMTAGALAINQTVQSQPRWDETNAFDNFFENRLTLDGRAAQRIDRASDVFALYSIAFPVLVDSMGMALIADKNKEVAGQLFAIQAQAFAMTGFLTSATKAAAGRERPYVDASGCEDTPEGCSASASQSFFSGHTAFAFTGAGLTCVQHRHLRLFGRVGDPLACGTALTVASATGLFRVMAGAHWMSDVLTGAGVGLFSGWVMPWLLHFRHDRSKKDDRAAARSMRFIAPYGTRNEVGLSATGAF